jgi:hypothetical protein
VGNDSTPKLSLLLDQHTLRLVLSGRIFKTPGKPDMVATYKNRFRQLDPPTGKPWKPAGGLWRCGERMENRAAVSGRWSRKNPATEMNCRARP